jgi:hypothetical protein
MRERLIDARICDGDLGITPAYAGKTIIIRAMLAKDRDHPRVCGKDYLGVAMELARKGSPPRMRERHIYT